MDNALYQPRGTNSGNNLKAFLKDIEASVIFFCSNFATLRDPSKQSIDSQCHHRPQEKIILNKIENKMKFESDGL